MKLLKGNRLEPDWLGCNQSGLLPGCTCGLCLPTTVLFGGKNQAECGPFGGVIASWKIPWIGLRIAANAIRRDCGVLSLINARISASGGASV